MQPNDFVYQQIYKGALSKGASERAAHNNALLGLEDYKKNKIFKKVSYLIEDRVKQAVKETKKGA